MATLHVDSAPLIPRRAPYPPAVGNAPNSLRIAKRSAAPQLALALEDNAQALTNIQGSLNTIHATLRQNTQAVQQVYVTDNTGKVIAAIGDFEYQGTVTPNYFSEIHVGDPLGTGNPALALFNAANGQVTIGQNGAVEVLDPFGNAAAWIGTQADTLAVSGAVNNGSGLIRLTVTGHTLQTGDTPTVLNVGGVPNATGIFTVTVVDANHIDLQNSVFVGTYTSGGTVNRILHVTGAANNGSGLIRLTVTGHGYVTGDEANVVSVGGVPNATGQWIVTVIDANHFDLQGSTFAGTYTSGGTCLRYFAGMLAQTVAIGPSFPGYKLRAFADGSLRISNATISLSAAGDTITLDPTGPSITSMDNLGNYVSMHGSSLVAVSATTNPQSSLSYNATGFVNSSGVPVVVITSNTGGTEAGTVQLFNSNATKSITIDPSASTAITTFGGGDINTSGVFRIGGVKVLGARQTGWSQPTATQSRASLTNAATLANVIQALAALIADLTNSGVIGA